MLRNTLIVLTAVAALGMGATALARGGGGHGGGFGSGGAGFHGGSFGGGGMSAVRGGGAAPTMRGGGMVGAPMVSGPVRGFNGGTFSRNNFAFNRGFHHHRHHRLHHNNFFAFGFAGPYFADYGYDCWRLVNTYYGWRRVYVCGDYSYWSYY